MSWKKVGGWLKENAGTGTALIGSLLTGNVPGAIAAGAALVSGATGTDNPDQALSILQSSPESMLKLKELYYQNEQSVRQHIETMELAKLKDQQDEHQETQKTIRGGDTATDEYVRRTRPRMARQSWNATVAYCLGCLVYSAIEPGDIFNVYVASVLSAPAWGYLGFRTGDKFSQAISSKKHTMPDQRGAR